MKPRFSGRLQNGLALAHVPSPVRIPDCPSNPRGKPPVVRPGRGCLVLPAPSRAWAATPRRAGGAVPRMGCGPFCCSISFHRPLGPPCESRRGRSRLAAAIVTVRASRTWPGGAPQRSPGLFVFRSTHAGPGSARNHFGHDAHSVPCVWWQVPARRVACGGLALARCFAGTLWRN
jgi:hypothetical protein